MEFDINKIVRLDVCAKHREDVESIWRECQNSRDNAAEAVTFENLSSLLERARVILLECESNYQCQKELLKLCMRIIDAFFDGVVAAGRSYIGSIYKDLISESASSASADDSASRDSSDESTYAEDDRSNEQNTSPHVLSFVALNRSTSFVAEYMKCCLLASVRTLAVEDTYGKFRCEYSKEYADLTQISDSGSLSENRNEEGQTRLHIAAKRDELDMVERLISEVPFEGEEALMDTPMIYVRDNNGRTAHQLAAAAAAANNSNAIAELLQRYQRFLLPHADLSPRVAGMTVFHSAAVRDDVDEFLRLLSCGEAVILDALTVRDYQGRTPLVSALLSRSWNVANCILDNFPGAISNCHLDAFIHLDGSTVFHRCIDSRIFEKLIIANPTVISVANFYGNTPLHTTRTTAYAKVLIDSGADIEAKNYFGHTPLFVALQGGRKEVAKYLIQRGASVLNMRSSPVDHVLKYAAVASVSYNSEYDKECVLVFQSSRNIVQKCERSISMFHDDNERTPKRFTYGSFWNISTEDKSTVLQRRLQCPDRVVVLVSPLSDTPTRDADWIDQFTSATDGTGRKIWHNLLVAGYDFVDIDLFRGDLSEVDDYNRNILHYVTSVWVLKDVLEKSSASMQVVEKLLDATDIFGRTPFHYWALNGVLNDRYFCQKFAGELTNQHRLSLKDNDGFSPEDLLKSLEKHGQVEEMRKETEDSVPKVTQKTINDEPGISPVIASSSPADSLHGSTHYINHLWSNLHYAYRDENTSAVVDCVRNFVTQLAALIGAEDARLTGLMKPVGSSFEGTKIDFPDEYDFNLELTRLSGICEVVSSTEYPPGFVQLRKHSNATLEDNELFGNWFDGDGMLLSTAVMLSFQTALTKVMKSRKFINSKNVLEIYPEDSYDSARYRITSVFFNRLCKQLLLTFNRPIDGKLLHYKISVDVVPVVNIAGWWPTGAVIVDDDIREIGCNFVLHQPYQKYRIPFTSRQFAKVSFARAEVLTLIRSPAVVRNALMVAKRIIKQELRKWIEPFAVKTAALYVANSIGSQLQTEDQDTAALVKCVSMLFQYIEDFASNGCVPTFFLPSFHVPLWEFEDCLRQAAEIVERNPCPACETFTDDTNSACVIVQTLNNALENLRIISNFVSASNEGCLKTLCEAEDQFCH